MINEKNIMNFFGEGAKFEHVGIAVKSISKEFGDLKIIDDPEHKVKVAFIHIHDIKVELVEPNSDKSPVNNILQKGQSLYHMTFLVPDLQNAINSARTHGFHCISKILPGKAYNNTNVTWVFSKVYGLVELIEKP